MEPLHHDAKLKHLPL